MVVVCFPGVLAQCKYRAERRRPICVEASHDVTMEEVDKYFWECTSCRTKYDLGPLCCGLPVRLAA